MSVEERERVIHPIVNASVQHNAKVLSQIRSLTASLFGVCAGILGLESVQGFLFYFFGTVLVSELVTSFCCGGASRNTALYFDTNAWTGLYLVDVFGGLSSYVLTWTLFYGLVRS